MPRALLAAALAVAAFAAPASAGALYGPICTSHSGGDQPHCTNEATVCVSATDGHCYLGSQDNVVCVYQSSATSYCAIGAP